MFGGLVDLMAAPGLGALTGLLGSWLTKREERASLTLKLGHEVEMAAIRKEEAAFEFSHELAMADKQVERAETEGRIALDVSEMAAFREGLKEQQMVYKIRIVDMVRGLMRPAITVYLLILASLVTWRIGALVGGLEAMDRAVLSGLYADTIGQVLFLVTTAVTWWFGSRPSSQRQ